LFEVDCGDGAFLLPLHTNGYTVGGIDEDASAIEAANAAMSGGIFQIGAATALDPAVPWDVVVCRSFAKSDDVDRMRGVIARMFAKATHAIALLDVPEGRRHSMLHALAEVGAAAIQFEDATGDSFNVFARSGGR
jgi:trans-aconitate methyltransferase